MTTAQTALSAASLLLAAKKVTGSSREYREAVALERERRRTMALERKQTIQDRVLDVALSPNMIRLTIAAAIIAYSTYCARSNYNVGPVQSALAFAGPGIGIPMLAADAGITDKFALAAISAAGIGYTTGQMLNGWSGVFPDASTLWQGITPWNDKKQSFWNYITPWED